MAEQHLLDILKQGVVKWNQWRKKNVELQLSLFRTDLSGADLRKFDLSGADLSGVDLSEANLSGAILSRSDLSGTDLSKAILNNTNLREAILNNSILSEANLSNARIGWTNFGDVDLRQVKGLETVIHLAPSYISTSTISRSHGNIPEAFLRGAGVDNAFIRYAHSLVNNSSEYYTCFISFSSKDQEFADRLYADLQSKGISCWFAPEDMDIGDKIRHRIEESINMYDKLLLILSEHSVASNWVAYEVERALNKEPKGVPNVLFPIRLDNAVLQCNAAWVDDIRSTRHIGDFGNWKNEDEYQKAFSKLLRALKA